MGLSTDSMTVRQFVSSIAAIFSSTMARNLDTSSTVVNRSENVRMHSCAHSRTIVSFESHTCGKYETFCRK